MSTVGPFAVAITQIAADATKAVFAAESDGPTPSTLASRLIDAAVGLVPVQELRAYLDAVDASSVDQAVDIAEEAKLAAQKMGG